MKTTKYTTKHLEKFNGLFDAHFGWRLVATSANHFVDALGDTVKEKESYYLKGEGAYSTRLSSRSMENILYVLFDRNPKLEAVANLLCKQAEEQLLDSKVDALSRVTETFRLKD